MPCLYRLAGQIYSGVQHNQSLELHSAMRLSEAKIQHVILFQIMPTVQMFTNTWNWENRETISKHFRNTFGKKKKRWIKKITSSSQTILETLKGALNENMFSSVCRALKKPCNLKTYLNHRRRILIYDLSEYKF